MTQIIIPENTTALEPGIYTLEELADVMQLIVFAIKNGERV